MAILEQIAKNPKMKRRKKKKREKWATDKIQEQGEKIKRTGDHRKLEKSRKQVRKDQQGSLKDHGAKTPDKYWVLVYKTFTQSPSNFLGKYPEM